MEAQSEVLLIGSCMTPSPRSIGVDQSMAKAHQLMRAHRIRHLPVLHGGKCVGIVTERDLHLVETLRDVDPQEVAVEDAMTPDPYMVPPSTPLAEVAREMIDRRLGSVVVAENERPVGIFTTVDAMEVLLAFISGEGPSPARTRATPRPPAAPKKSGRKVARKPSAASQRPKAGASRSARTRK